MSSKWQKKLNKCTNKYIKQIKKSEFNEEELVVLNTFILLNVNSLIYFVEAIGEMKSDYTSIKSIWWKTELEKMSQEEFTNIHTFLLSQYFLDKVEESLVLKKEDKQYAIDFNFIDIYYKFGNYIKGYKEEHLIDSVFRELRLEEVNRNEVVVLAFKHIVSDLYERYDKNIPIVLEKLKNTNK